MTYMTVPEAAAHLRFPTVGAFRQFLYRRRKAGHPVRTIRRGRILLFLKSDLDDAMPVEQAPKHLRKASGF
jgi:hypothetical protein